MGLSLKGIVKSVSKAVKQIAKPVKALVGPLTVRNLVGHVPVVGGVASRALAVVDKAKQVFRGGGGGAVASVPNVDLSGIIPPGISQIGNTVARGVAVTQAVKTVADHFKGGSMGDDEGLYEKIDRGLFGGLLPFGQPFGQSNIGAGAGACGSRLDLGDQLTVQAVASGSLKMATKPVTVQRVVAPPGYVLVCAPNGEKIAVLKPIAYALGLRKRPVKGGGLTRRELQAAAKVQRFLSAHTVARKPKGALLRAGKKR